MCGPSIQFKGRAQRPARPVSRLWQGLCRLALGWWQALGPRQPASGVAQVRAQLLQRAARRSGYAAPRPLSSARPNSRSSAWR